MTEPVSHLDQAVIAELQGIMGDSFGLLVDTFRQDSLGRIESLRQHVAGGAAEDVRQVAHSFKGSAANLGALQLASLCQSLEAMGKSADLADAPVRLQHVETEFTYVIAELEALLPG
ncbi:MAG: Hpt domain-containing protein [Gammaproteobacteria bacterium]|nr:MAG: Hpt domain-containing protein [Gammaproteobacteria bacterium]